MKEDLFFVFKMLGLTALVIMVLQVRSGGKTLEEHFDGFLKTSILVDYIQEATDGGVALGKVGYQKVDIGVHALMAKLSRQKGNHPKGLNVATKHQEIDGKEEEAKAHRSFLSRFRHEAE